MPRLLVADSDAAHVCPLEPQMKSQAAESLWDAEDVAVYLKVSRSMVYKLGQSGELPCLRVGACLRFDPGVVRAFARGELRGKPGGGIVRLGPRADPAHGASVRYED
jgi:excisionase family DNA binding protein